MLPCLAALILASIFSAAVSCGCLQPVRESRPAPSCVAMQVSQSPAPIIMSTSRFIIDRFNYTFNLQTDERYVSVGSYDAYQDTLGSARATAVLFQTPSNALGAPYLPTRCDFLFSRAGGTTRATIGDFSLSIYADDGSSGGNPGVQVRIWRLECPSRLAYSLITPRALATAHCARHSEDA